MKENNKDNKPQIDKSTLDKYIEFIDSCIQETSEKIFQEIALEYDSLEDVAFVLSKLKDYYSYRRYTVPQQVILDQVVANLISKFDESTYRAISTLTTCFDVKAISKSSLTKK